MVQVDFTECKSWSTCPVWWQNFVDSVVENHTHHSIELRNQALESAIAKFNGRIIDDESGPEDIDYVEFETEYDLAAFKLIWTLYGK